MNTTNKSIAERAYALWEARGCPHGSAEQDWLEAEQLAARSMAAAPPSEENDSKPAIDSFSRFSPSKASETQSAPKERGARSRSPVSPPSAPRTQ
jgi:hypothetical protein